jgi:translocation and assembly module TamA
MFSKKRKKFAINYDVTDFLSPKQKLLNEAYTLNEYTRAYKGWTRSIGSSIQRPLNDELTAIVGVVAEQAKISRKEERYSDKLFGTPVEIVIDKSNDLLNPTRGFRAKGKFTPYFGAIGKDRKMAILRGGGSIYLPLHTDELDEDTIVWASFAKGGIVYIQDFSNLPPHKRFYAGGGGSVRGYGYQMLGPLDSDRIPIGGESVIELGTELRFKVSQNIGFVGFFEAGSVNIKKMPSLKTNNIFYGTGLGFRYYSQVGPIRFDIGIPLKRRKDGGKKPIDSPWQIYLSIGHAF